MEEKEIAILYQSGLTIREIAKQCNKSYETVRQILKSQKVKWTRNYVSDLTKDQIENIINRYVNKKQSIKEIAAWYEMSPPAIARLLKANNITVIDGHKKYDILRETPINSVQKQFIVGTLLGDGCLYKDSPKSNFKLSIGQCEAQEQYFHWKVAMMDPFINGFNRLVNKRKNSIMLQTRTITHKDFNIFADMFYTNDRVKIIPDNLDIYLTPLALAVWVMDDGNLKSGVNMRIATMSFTESDNYKLQSYLKKCFDLNSKVMGFKMKDKQYFQITLNKENTQKLSNIIREYVVDCMKYKLMPEPSTTLR
jgi:predicted DNA-binding protein YlxM (UPF0122 family)